MKAAGPSQSCAQFLRVEYMTLKSFSPCRSNMFSSLSESSAMHPTKYSILSFLFLGNDKLLMRGSANSSIEMTDAVLKCVYKLLDGSLCSPFLCCHNFSSILLRGIAITRKNLKPAVCGKHPQINKYLCKTLSY